MLFVSKEYVSNQKIAKFVAGVVLLRYFILKLTIRELKVSVLQSLTACPSYRSFVLNV